MLPKPGFATSVEIWIWDRHRRCCRAEAVLLDDLDCLGSAWDAELFVDRRDVGLDGRATEVEPIGDLLKRAVYREEAEDPELGRREPGVAVLARSVPRAPQAVGERSGIGMSVESVARTCAKFQRGDRFAEVEADLGASQREIDVSPRGRA